MNNDNVLAELEQVKTMFNIEWNFGYSKNKIAAINRDIPTGKWDILVNISDDMWCEQVGWDNEIRKKFTTDFSDNDGFIHWWDGDGNTRAKLCTYSIFGRKYYDRFGYIYHPDYTSLWCDNEAMEVAQKLNKYRYFDDILFRHIHYSNTKGLHLDNLMLKTQSFFLQDKRIYEIRKRKNFDL